MMITIHGLPPRTTFQAVKTLVKQECNVIDFILDDLVDDGPNSKKVRIGLSDDAEGYRIIKCLDGFRMSPTHLLKIVPVGKHLKPPTQENYDQRPGFSSQVRNEYSNHSRTDYPNLPNNDYGNRGPTGAQVPPDSRNARLMDSRHYGGPDQGHIDARAADTRSSGPLRPPNVRAIDQRHAPAEPRHSGIQGPQDPIPSQQWGSNVNPVNNQWDPSGQGSMQTQNNYNQRPMQSAFGQQHPHGATDSYAQPRGPPDQGYVYQPKPNIPERVVPPRQERQHVLRSVEIVDTPRAPARPPQQDKPITIMKDNFQGPTQYNVPGQAAQHSTYSGHGPQNQQPVWMPVTQQAKTGAYDERRHQTDKRADIPAQIVDEYDKRDRYSPSRTARHVSPGRTGAAGARRFPEGNRRGSPGRSFPEGDRRVSPSRLGPHVREFSPSGRRIPQSAGRISPPGRRVSPHGRRVSPLGRRASPPGRRVSPSGRRLSPSGRRLSPPGRKLSPGRRDEPRRMSPSDRRAPRRDSPRRVSPTPASARAHGFPSSRLGDKPSDKFVDDVKGPKPVRPAYEPSHEQKQTYTGGYRNNDARYSTSGRQPEAHPSPWQNDKILFPSSSNKEEDRRDMTRRPEKGDMPPDRHSRSPHRRDRSPLKDRYRRHSPSPRSSRSPRRSWALEKRSSTEAIREPPPPPVWPGQDPVPIPRFETEEPKHDPVWDRRESRQDDRKTFEHSLRVRTDLQEKKFSDRHEIDDRRDFREVADRKPVDRDREYRRDDRPEFSRLSPAPRDDKRSFMDIDKDFQDIYKRAVEFRKKTEERKSADKRREGFEERRREEDRPSRREPSPRRDRSLDRNDFERAGREWNTKDRKHVYLSADIKAKRDKAIEEIINRILDDYDIHGQQLARLTEELRVALWTLFIDMFSDEDVSFIELVIKYRAKYSVKEEQKLVQDVLSRMPSQYRNLKRKASGSSNVPTKTSRRSPPGNSREETARPKLSDAVIPEWSAGIAPPKMMNLQLVGMNPVMNMPNQGMVPAPVYVASHMDMPQQNLFQHQKFSSSMVQQQQQQFESSVQDQQTGLYNLFLCQDDFEPFSELQALYLKNFLVSQIVKVSSQGSWAPDITLKGLQSLFRYELTTKDELSKDWILNLDFTEFEYFNVLVYTKEELWYERAAVWLPGHSRGRNIEPLEKLRMQNKRLEGVNIGKWKFVKKIVTAKGTRLYVDMPPSSARALEKHKMLLSYELQKVNVFLKAVAVDKETFDAGLKESSITDHSLIVAAVQSSPMPTLNANIEPGIVKIGLNGKKSLTLEQCRKIKEVVVYNLIKYLQIDGSGKTDYLKYGFCPPCHLGIVPENPESKRWLTSRNFGKMNRHNIVVFGDDDDNTRYFKMIAYIPHEYHSSTSLAFERLKQSNQGIKGIHFNLWKAVGERLKNERKSAALELEVDMESVEVLSRMKYKLDYVGEYGIQVVDFRSEYSLSKLEEKIKKYKMEQMDKYDVANMDLESDSDKDDVVCIDD